MLTVLKADNNRAQGKREYRFIFSLENIFVGNIRSADQCLQIQDNAEVKYAFGLEYFTLII